LPGDELAWILTLQRLAELLLDHRGVGNRLRREMIVRVEIQLLHQPFRRIGGFREFLQFTSRVQVVVPIFRLLVPPPLLDVPAVQPHVVKALHVRQVVLPDGEAELRLVDLDPRRAEGVQERERVADSVAPASVTELDGYRIAAECAEQSGQVIARRRDVLEARRKLSEERDEPAARGQGLAAAAETVEGG